MHWGCPTRVTDHRFTRILALLDGISHFEQQSPRLGSQARLELGAHCFWCVAWALIKTTEYNFHARITISDQRVGEPRSTRLEKNFPSYRVCCSRHTRTGKTVSRAACSLQLAAPAQIVPRASKPPFVSALHVVLNLDCLLQRLLVVSTFHEAFSRRSWARFVPSSVTCQIGVAPPGTPQAEISHNFQALLHLGYVEGLQMGRYPELSGTRPNDVAEEAP